MAETTSRHDFVRSNRTGGAETVLRTSPGAKNTGFKGPYGDETIRVRVAAPPVDGEANPEIVRFIARTLDVPESDVGITYGLSSRDKIVRVSSLDADHTYRKISGRPGPG